MNYQLQHRMHYQYMLEGYDKEWRNADKTRTASYSGVPTGNYRFKVKAFLLDSPDKYDMRTIEVIIPPHPLYSGNAILFYIVLAITITLILLFWQKKRQVKKQNLKVIKLGPQEMAFVHKEDYDFVKSQLNWLEANYSNPELKIEDLVEQSKHNRTDYYKQMKELTGQTPKDFVNDFRIKKAVMFLENTNDTIAEIAAKTGFNDPLLFTRLFMQKIGVTPSKYREQKNLEREGHETIHET
jgi:AraC-like DNA-binding protein